MASRLDLLPLDDSQEGVRERSGDYWDVSGPFPIPTWEVKCEQCGSEDVQGRTWIFHSWRDRKRHPWRCDVHFKCRRCAKVWVHGVVVPQEMYETHCKKERTASYTWREVRYFMRWQEADLSADKPDETKLRRVLGVKV